MTFNIYHQLILVIRVSINAMAKSHRFSINNNWDSTKMLHLLQDSPGWGLRSTIHSWDSETWSSAAFPAVFTHSGTLDTSMQPNLAVFMDACSVRPHRNLKTWNVVSSAHLLHATNFIKTFWPEEDPRGIETSLNKVCRHPPFSFTLLFRKPRSYLMCVQPTVL